MDKNSISSPAPAREAEPLEDIALLFGRAFSRFKACWLPCALLMLSLVAHIAVFVGLGVVASLQGLGIAAVFLWAAAGVGAAWIGLGLYKAAVFEGLGYRGALQSDFQEIAAFTLPLLYCGALILPGLALLLVPGIILMVWFSFVPFIVLRENKTGFAALARSRELCRGKFWWVFMYAIISAAISQVVSFVPVLGFVLVLVAPALGILLLDEVYKALQARCPEAPYTADGILKGMVALSLAGMLAMALGAGLAFKKHGGGWLEQIKKKIVEEQNIDSIENEIGDEGDIDARGGRSGNSHNAGDIY
jgi:hypothetical protein